MGLVFAEVQSSAKASDTAKMNEAAKAQSYLFATQANAVRGIEFDDEETTFPLESQGLYADVVMGVGVGADQYAKDRRDLEFRRVSSEISVNEARAKWLLSRTASTGGHTKTANDQGGRQWLAGRLLLRLFPVSPAILSCWKRRYGRTAWIS